MPDPPTGRRRSALQRTLIGVNAVVLVAVVVGASVLGYGWWRFQEVDTVEIPTPTVPEGAEEPAEDEPTSPLDPGGPRNYLLVGSDTREGQDAEAFGTTDDSGSVNADTILVVRIDPGAQTIDVVSFLRDLWVEVHSPDGDPIGPQRINTALADGEDGHRGLIHTLAENFDIPIHHYAKVSFDGFKELVDAVGGVEVPLEHSVRDWDPEEGRNPTGLNIVVDEPQCLSLAGDMALAYVRARHFQELRDGRWVTDPTSDHGRTRRQRDVIQRAIRKAIAEGRTSPATVNELFGIATDSVTVDERMSPPRLAAIANAFRDAPADAVRDHELETVPITRGRAQVLDLPESPANQAILGVFRGVEPASPPDAAPLAGPPGPAGEPPPEAEDAPPPPEEPADLC
jgi:polyisoprenyl-teichoic acid--peptidoglycan teichoic acid transferase